MYITRRLLPNYSAKCLHDSLLFYEKAIIHTLIISIKRRSAYCVVGQIYKPNFNSLVKDY